VLRAHTLTYAPLRRLADITDSAEIHLSLVVHAERLPGPVAQLLESLPHDKRELDRLLEQTPDLTDDGDGVDELPAGAGLEFPYLHDIGGHDGRPRSAIARSLSRAQRAEVLDLWDQAHAWMTRWIDEHPDAPYQQHADAVYFLARHGDSASEIYIRIRAALDAFTRAGEDIDAEAIDPALHWSFGEICQFKTLPSPAPPRRFIATQHERLSAYANDRRGAMLPGAAHGRMGQQVNPPRGRRARRSRVAVTRPARHHHRRRRQRRRPPAPAHPHRMEPLAPTPGALMRTHECAILAWWGSGANDRFAKPSTGITRRAGWSASTALRTMR
jgi:hypothetical protein